MNAEVVQALAEATPPAGMPAPEAATPLEPAQQAETPTPPAEEWLELPDPSDPNRVYTKVPKDPVKLAQWVIDRNKDYAEERDRRTRLEGQVEAFRSGGLQTQRVPEPQAPAPAVQAPQNPTDPEIVSRSNELYAEYVQQYDAEPAQIWAAAVRDARTEINAERRMFTKLQQREAANKNEQVFRENPVLESDFGVEVFNQYGGKMTAEMHLALVNYEATKRGVDLSQYGAKPALSPSTRTSVQASVASRTAAMGTPATSAAPAQNAPRVAPPELRDQWQSAVNIGNYTQDQANKLWDHMQRSYFEKQGVV